MSEVSKRPTTLFVPALDYPAPMAKQVRAYEAAHKAWNEAYVAVVAAELDVTNAPARDAEALASAAAAGKAHPGEKHAEAARRTLEMAEEKCRVAREAATAQTDVMRAALSEAVDLLLPLALDHIRATASHYESVVAECKATEAQARRDLSTAVGAMQMVATHLATNYGIHQVWTSSPIPAPTWPVNADLSLEAKLANVERHVAEAKAGRELRSRERVTT